MKGNITKPCRCVCDPNWAGVSCGKTNVFIIILYYILLLQMGIQIYMTRLVHLSLSLTSNKLITHGHEQTAGMFVNLK